MTATGHEEQFLPAKLKARFTVNKQTFAGPRSNGPDAPKAASFSRRERNEEPMSRAFRIRQNVDNIHRCPRFGISQLFTLFSRARESGQYRLSG
jgi:hypothetical protein